MQHAVPLGICCPKVKKAARRIYLAKLHISIVLAHGQGSKQAPTRPLSSRAGVFQRFQEIIKRLPEIIQGLSEISRGRGLERLHSLTWSSSKLGLRKCKWWSV